LLLASGVNRDVRTRSGETALDLAIDAGHVDVALVLRRAGAEGEVTADTLVGYARGGRVASLRVLLALGVPAEQRDAGGRSALMEASRWGKTDAVRLLLDAGADPDRVDSRGRRPLLVAADWDQLPAVDLLLARGADVNAQDPGGATALHQAAAGGNPDIARVLLRYRADTGIKDTDGDTPLVAAVLGREPDLVRLLIASGCDVNEPTVARRATGNQTTPLGIAVWMHSRYSSDEDTAAVEDLLRAAGARE
jgi:ankyrin repeat protein